MNFFEELKIKRVLSKFGYTKNQIEKIIPVINDQISLLFFTNDYRLSDGLIDEYIIFLSGNFVNYRSYMLSVEFNKRNYLIRFCNRIDHTKIDGLSVNLFRLLYGVSMDYEEGEFIKILSDLLNNNLDNNYINNLNEEYKLNSDTKVLVKKNKNN